MGLPIETGKKMASFCFGYINSIDGSLPNPLSEISHGLWHLTSKRDESAVPITDKGLQERQLKGAVLLIDGLMKETPQERALFLTEQTDACRGDPDNLYDIGCRLSTASKRLPSLIKKASSPDKSIYYAFRVPMDTLGKYFSNRAMAFVLDKPEDETLQSPTLKDVLDKLESYARKAGYHSTEEIESEE